MVVNIPVVLDLIFQEITVRHCNEAIQVDLVAHLAMRIVGKPHQGGPVIGIWTYVYVRPVTCSQKVASLYECEVLFLLHVVK